MTDHRPIIAVIPCGALDTHARLFDALQQAFDVRFERYGQWCDAVLFAGEDAAPSLEAAAFAGVPTLAVGGQAPADAPREDVLLSRHPAIDRRLHGIVIDGQPAGRALAPAPGEAIIAAGASGPAWTTSTHNGVRVDRMSGPLPEVGPQQVLRDALRGPGAPALLALVQMLRAVAPHEWSAPPLRATFVFDDPNLRRPTYGHIDYRALVRHADEHGYHAAMAMVPLDVGSTSAEAVETFGTRPDRLSLAIHGNDHSRDELMQPGGHEEALALGAQALRRIERFERTTQLFVDRVMMPPHGLCSRHVVSALGALGYEAVCAIHPAPWTERTPADRVLAGWSPAEFIDGCAVLPRFPLDVWMTEIAIRAFLDQPLVLYGHHGDMADGLHPLAQAAERVNGMGEVRWCSTGQISRMSSSTSVRGDVLHVRPWARELRLTVPAGVTSVLVHAPPGAAATGFHEWALGSGMRRLPSAFGDAKPVAPGETIDVSLVPALRTDPRTVADPPARVWPLARRRATEARDRLSPLWPV